MSKPHISQSEAQGADGRTTAANVCVAIATRGRPGVLASVIGLLRHQTLQPSSIIVCGVSPEDAGDLRTRDDVVVLTGRPGLPTQRNEILRHLPGDADIIVFFDDDFVPHRNWLESVATTFRDHPDVASVTGRVIADGIKGPGISFEDACALVAAFEPGDEAAPIERTGPYGCNMAFRRSAIGDLRFDERLVLYGWLEDRDFGAALARQGWRTVKIGTAAGVHMGIKKGRVSGRQFGYSQVMNPIYMRGKRTMAVPAVADHIIRNISANLMRALTPEPHIDRSGRLIGNLLGLMDVLRGRITPERAERL